MKWALLLFLGHSCMSFALASGLTSCCLGSRRHATTITHVPIHPPVCALVRSPCGQHSRSLPAQASVCAVWQLGGTAPEPGAAAVCGTGCICRQVCRCTQFCRPITRLLWDQKAAELTGTCDVLHMSALWHVCISFRAGLAVWHALQPLPLREGFNTINSTEPNPSENDLVISTGCEQMKADQAAGADMGLGSREVTCGPVLSTVTSMVGRAGLRESNDTSVSANAAELPPQHANAGFHEACCFKDTALPKHRWIKSRFV